MLSTDAIRAEVFGDASHSDPVQLDLPPWSVAAAIDLRGWLFGYGGGIRIDQPNALCPELVQCSKTAHRSQCRTRPCACNQPAFTQRWLLELPAWNHTTAMSSVQHQR